MPVLGYRREGWIWKLASAHSGGGDNGSLCFGAVAVTSVAVKAAREATKAMGTLTVAKVPASGGKAVDLHHMKPGSFLAFF
jgi:hypothetical protein